MLTRYQYKANLYNDVLEEPNIMSNIIQHLSPKDVLTLIQSNGEFTHEPRFKDTISIYLQHQYKLHKERVEKRFWSNRRFVFNQTMKRIRLEFMNNFRLSKLDEMFECIRDNKDVLAHFDCEEFLDVTEQKLIEFIHHEDYGLNAIRFLGEIFNIYIKARPIPNTEDEFVEFIEDRKGNIVWI